MENYDLVILGAGPGGYVGAIRAAQLGLTVALVEKDEVGGTCLNRGCVPTKTLLHSAELYKEAKENFSMLGLHCKELAYNPEEMFAHKEEVVKTLKEGIEGLLKANKVTLYRGTGQVVASGRVKVVLAEEGQEPLQLAAGNILLATGSKPAMPPIPGCGLPGVFTSDGLLASPKIYPRLIIVGAGVIGVEFASLYAALGCEVTLLEAAPRALPTMSREVAQGLTAALKKEGAGLYAGACVQKIEQQGQALACTFTQKEAEKTLVADAVLIATGRRPVLEGVVAEELKLQTERGFVVVDKQFCTNIAGVYAVGDILAGPQLAHLASAEAVAAVEGIAGKPSCKNLALVPACIYSQPEIATVGITEEEAAEKGIAVETGKFLMAGNSRVLLAGAGRSYVKLIAAKDTGVLLGAELVCPRATDIVNQLTFAIAAGKTVRELDDIIYPHPTFGEAVGEAAALFGDGAIHAVPRPRRQ